MIFAMDVLKSQDQLKSKQTTLIRDRVVRIDFLTFLYISILVLAVIECYFRCLSYFLFGDVYSDLACFLGAFVIFTLLILYLLKSKIIVIYSLKYCKFDILFVGIFTFFLLIKLPFPDYMYDTRSVEILIQNYSFTSVFENLKPYLPGVSGWYSLYSRVFFYVRVILGHRISIIVNLLIVITSYYKVKELLFALFEETKTNLARKLSSPIGIFIVSFASCCILFRDFLIMGMTIVKSDLFIIPLFLECIRLAFLEKELTPNHYVLAGLLVGCSISIKLTNATFFIPIIVYVIISDSIKKVLKTKKVILALSAAIIPILPFALFSLTLTGNPIFPFFNSIFRSEFFVTTNLKDSRWGPTNAIETLLWPIIVVFNTSRYGEFIQASPVSNGSLALGYISAFISVPYYCIFNRQTKRLPLAICLISSTVLWSVSTGYIRYALCLEVFSLLFVTIWIFDLLSEKKQFLPGFLSPFIMLSLTFSFIFVGAKNNDWSHRYSPFTTQWSQYWAIAKANLSLIGHDQGRKVEEKFAEVKTWICIDYLTAYSVLANPTANIFVPGMPSNAYSLHDNIDAFFRSHEDDGLYMLVDSLSQEILTYLDNLGLCVIKVEWVNTPFIQDGQMLAYLSLIKKEYSEQLGIETINNPASWSALYKYKLGDTIGFTRDYGNANSYFTHGLYYPESGHTWSDGGEAIFRAILDQPISSDLRLELSFFINDYQTISLYAENRLIGEMNFSVPGSRNAVFIIPKDVINDDNTLTLAFRFPHAHIEESGPSIAIGFVKMTITQDIPQYLIGDTINFTRDNGNAQNYFIYGLGSPEATHTWSDGYEAVFEARLDRPVFTDLELEMSFFVNTTQTIKFYAGDCLINESIFRETGHHNVALIIPKDTIIEESILLLRFEFPNTLDTDTEELYNIAIGFIEMKISSVS